MKNKNVIDHFLDALDDSNNPNRKYRKVYKRVPIFKSLCSFLFAFVCLVLMVLSFGFSFNILYLIMFFGCIIVIIVNGINLFSKDGIKIPTHEEIVEDHDMSKEDKYKMQ